MAYSIPWGRMGENVTSGWGFTIPFSFTYLIGILLGLIVLLIKFRPVIMTIIAGILMIIGVVGAVIGIGLAKVVGVLAGKEVSSEIGLGFAFLISLIYTVMGSYIGKKMGEMEMPSPEYTIPIIKPKALSCPKCGSGNIVGYMGEYECMDCGYKFRIAQQIRPPKPSPPSETAVSHPSGPSKGIWITLAVVLLIIGFLFGGIVGYSSRETTTTVSTLIYPTTVTHTVMATKTLPTTITLLVTRTIKLSFTKLVTITTTPKPRIHAEIITAESVIKDGKPYLLVKFNVTAKAIIRLIGPDGVEKDRSRISPPETGVYLSMIEHLYGYETPPAGEYRVIIEVDGIKIAEKEFKFSGYSVKVVKFDFIDKKWSKYSGGSIDGVIIHLQNDGDLPTYISQAKITIDEELHVRDVYDGCVPPGKTTIQISVWLSGISAGTHTVKIELINDKKERVTSIQGKLTFP